jgi:hypothetical protein
LPALAFWAGGISLILAAILVAPLSTAGAIALVVGGFGLVGVYWTREHPGGPSQRIEWEDEEWYIRERGEWGSGAGGGEGGGGGGGGGDGGG